MMAFAGGETIFKETIMNATIDLLFAGLRQRRQQHADALEELAARLAAGEHVSPDEAQAFLDRAGVDEDALPPVLRRHQDRQRLKQAIQDGHAAETKLTVIDRKVAEANAAVDAAVDARDKLIENQWEQTILLRQRVQRGKAAVDELLLDKHLAPADGQRLAAARDAGIAAHQAAEDCRRQISELTTQIDDAEKRVAVTKEAAAKHPRCEASATAATRAKNRHRRLQADLKEARARLPALEKEATAAATAVDKVEAELRSR